MSDEFPDAPFDNLFQEDRLAWLRAKSPEEQARVIEAAREVRLALIAMLLELEGRE